MKLKKGFTLIELLVVISIISVLSSIVLASLNSARVKAHDVRRRADFRSIDTAMELYYDKHGRYPPAANPQCVSSCISADHMANFNFIMGELVSDGDLASVPQDPKPYVVNAEGTLSGYMAFDYGSGNTRGVLFVTYLEGISPTNIPPFGSCRPFTQNWCPYDAPTRAFCVCHPY